jgi:hypothetical protein
MKFDWKRASGAYPPTFLTVDLFETIYAVECMNWLQWSGTPKALY